MTERNLHVLVVDDDMMARMSAAQCLKQQGHTAVMADGGKQGLEMLESQDFDLVLLDLLMPDLDGIEVLRQLKTSSILQRTPVIVVTGSDEDQSIAKCLEMGATSHLRKPLDPALLADRIKACLAMGS